MRQNFEPVFDVPVTIRDDAPLGTHVFTVRKGGDEGGFAWSVVSLPTADKTLTVRKPARTLAGKSQATPSRDVKPGPEAILPAAVLDRIEIPNEALQRIAYHLSPGSSIIVSDLGLNAGGETGRGTEFIVPLR